MVSKICDASIGAWNWIAKGALPPSLDWCFTRIALDRCGQDAEGLRPMVAAIGCLAIPRRRAARSWVRLITTLMLGLSIAACDRPRPSSQESFVTTAATQLAAMGFVGSAQMQLSPLFVDSEISPVNALAIYDQLVGDGFEFVATQSSVDRNRVQARDCAGSSDPYLWLEKHRLGGNHYFATNIQLNEACAVKKIVVMVAPTRGVGD
jgi:hypothetical protein